MNTNLIETSTAPIQATVKPLDLGQVIGDLNQTIAEIDARLSAPVMDGTPYVIVLDRPEDQSLRLSQRPVLGSPYRDQDGNNPKQTRTRGDSCFRMQRGHTLCGCYSYSPERVGIRIAEIKSSNPELPLVAVHSRDWLSDAREGCKRVVNQLLAFSTATENFSD